MTPGKCENVNRNSILPSNSRVPSALSYPDAAVAISQKKAVTLGLRPFSLPGTAPESELAL
jgi:hypothetical protein